MLSPRDRNLQLLPIPSFNLADHLRNFLPHRRSSSSDPKADPKPKQYVPQPPVIGCPVNNLPPEILSWIFVLGEEIVREEEEEEDEEENAIEADDKVAEKDSEIEGISGEDGDDSDWEDEPEDDDDDESISPRAPPFQVLVSHVCHYWRQVAIETPSLWNCIDFSEGKPYEKSTVYLGRSKGYPLVISIDYTEEDLDSDSCSESGGSSRGCADLETMLSLIIPHVGRWASFHLTADEYSHMHTALKTFSTAPSAPLLESLEFYHYEEEADGSMETFTPASLKTPFVLFNNELPRLHSVTFWGVHIDWTNTNFLKNLIHLELAYHCQDVRPTFQEFFSFLCDSPSLETLKLCLSGPRGDPVRCSTILPPRPSEPEDVHATAPGRVQVQEFLTLGSLHTLSLEFDPPGYIEAILDRLVLPNLRDLSLNFEDYDYSAFVSYLASPAKYGGKKEPIISHLKSLKLVQLPCSRSAVKLLYDTLNDLEAWGHLFGPDPIYPPNFYPSNYRPLPSLTSIAISGLDCTSIRRLVQDRKEAGFPLKKLYVDEDSEIDEEDEEWFNEHVEEFSYFVDTDDELDEGPDEEDWI